MVGAGHKIKNIKKVKEPDKALIVGGAGARADGLLSGSLGRRGPNDSRPRLPPWLLVVVVVCRWCQQIFKRCLGESRLLGLYQPHYHANNVRIARR